MTGLSMGRLTAQLTMVVFLTTIAIGCTGQQQVTNPFVTADRVPAPAQRTMMPGVAQPYYPNDPTPAQPHYPPGAAVAAPAGAFVSQVTPPASQSLSVAAGPSITIPSDNQQLRMPAHINVPTQQVAAQPLATPTTFQQTPAGAPNQFATLQAPVPQVQQASRGPSVSLNPVPSNRGFDTEPYAASASQVNEPETTEFYTAGTQSDGLAWNSGSAPRRSTAQAIPTASQGQPVVVASTAPRVRFPSSVSQASYQSPAQTSNVGRMPIIELPPSPARY